MKVTVSNNNNIGRVTFGKIAKVGAITLNEIGDVDVVGTSAEQNNRILIGHANGKYITTSVSGNVTISNTGVVTIGTGQVVGSMLANTLVGEITFANNLYVNENLRVRANIEFANSTNTLMAYMYYNESSDSIDTVFV